MNNETVSIRRLLSTLWIVITVNFIFCDVFTLMYSEELQKILTGTIDGMVLTQGFLLAFAVIMEIPMVMIVLARIMPHALNRRINLIAAAFLILVQGGSLFAGSNTLHYLFFSVVEISILLVIVVLSWRWNASAVTRPQPTR